MLTQEYKHEVCSIVSYILLASARSDSGLGKEARLRRHYELASLGYDRACSKRFRLDSHGYGVVSLVFETGVEEDSILGSMCISDQEDAIVYCAAHVSDGSVTIFCTETIKFGSDYEQEGERINQIMLDYWRSKDD